MAHKIIFGKMIIVKFVKKKTPSIPKSQNVHSQNKQLDTPLSHTTSVPSLTHYLFQIQLNNYH